MAFLEGMGIGLQIIIAWLVFGFLGFLIEAKCRKITEFENEIPEFIACVVLGLISFVAFLFDYVISKKFVTFMNWLLKKINQ